MGLCASTGDVGEIGETHRNPTTNKTKRSGDLSAADVQIQISEDLSPESDADFRLVIKEVAIMALDQLCRALEYEKEGYLEVAQKRGQKSYLALMSPDAFKTALSELLEVAPVKKSKLPSDHVNHDQDCYLSFLAACKKAPYRNPQISKEALTTTLQKATTITQKSLRDSADAADASDLKLHLFFFVNCLNCLQGDLVKKPGTLFKNVKTFVSGEPVGKTTGLPKGV